jgi:hypothetical protein
LSKNTRWALAIVGAAILIVAVVVIATGKEDTKATTDNGGRTSPAPTQTTGPTQGGGATGATGGGSDSGSGDSGGATPGSGSGGSGDNGSGGASPDGDSGNGSGGAGAETSSTTPVLKAGSVKTITVKKGDKVTIRAKSDTADELHIHGYDKEVELEPGKTGSITFTADIDGIFAIELHHSDSQVGTLRVNP